MAELDALQHHCNYQLTSIRTVVWRISPGCKNLQSRLVPFGGQSNRIRHARVGLEANRLAMRRRVNDALRE